MKMLLKYCFVSLVLLFQGASLAAERTSPSTFMDHMRVLSESRGLVWKAYKSHIMIGMKNHFQNPEKVLLSSIQAYEKAISGTRTYLETEHYDKALPFLDQADKEWYRLKPNLLNMPKKANINTIDKQSMKLTRTIIKVLKAMGSYDHSGNWKYLEQTQKAQNIAQRMATLYLNHSWKALDPKRYDKMMSKVIGNYKKVEHLIHSSRFLTPDIKETLAKAKKDFMFFKMMSDSKHTVLIPTLIYKKSSDLDRKMGHCTTLIMAQL